MAMRMRFTEEELRRDISGLDQQIMPVREQVLPGKKDPGNGGWRQSVTWLQLPAAGSK